MTEIEYKSNDSKLLKNMLTEHNIKVTDEQIKKLFDFYRMVIKKNEVMNLTGITEVKEFMIKHIFDSLIVLKYYDINNIISDGGIIMDIGTGAGFPGVPLAILCPDKNFILVDALKKRLDFIEGVCDKLEIKNIETVHGRFEDLGHDSKYREKCDLILSRAVAPLNVLIEYAIPFLKKGGDFISYKSKESEAEIEKSKTSFEELSSKLKEKYEYYLPISEEKRVLLVINKEDNTIEKYPRKPGKIQKKPL